MKTLLIAWRELQDLVSDRSYLLGMIFLGLMPIVLTTTIGGSLPARRSAPLVFIFAVQSVVFPAFMTVNAAATTFVQEKEAQTLLPLLAAPIRDAQIVVGKALAVIVPSTLAAWAALLIYRVAASFRFGADIAADVLSPGTLASLAVLAMLMVLTLGSLSMVVASRVRTIRAAQQISGLGLGLLAAALFAGASFLGSALEGWLVVVVPVAVLLLDVAALELTRRLWTREEAITRI